jgi:predicted transcriptional regulator
METDQDKYETTVRMEGDLARRLDVISSVTRESKNSLIVAGTESVIESYEDDEEYQAQRAAFIESLTP